MSPRVIQFGQFGGVSKGPQSHPWADTGHDWLNEREDASHQDAAFNAADLQKHQTELGGAPWIEGEADIKPVMEGDKSRWGGRTGTSKHIDIQSSAGPRERLGLQFKVKNEDASPEILGGPAPTHEPVTHLYRGMGEGEFQEAKTRGFILSDERGVIEPGVEGTNAAVDMGTAHNYLPQKGPGRIVKMSVHPQDEWFTTTHDDYARTRAPIPWSRVEAHTSSFDKSKASDIRGQVVEKQKREGR
jgi:hypothetical protein